MLPVLNRGVSVAVIVRIPLSPISPSILLPNSVVYAFPTNFEPMNRNKIKMITRAMLMRTIRKVLLVSPEFVLGCASQVWGGKEAEERAEAIEAGMLATAIDLAG